MYQVNAKDSLLIIKIKFSRGHGRSFEKCILLKCKKVWSNHYSYKQTILTKCVSVQHVYKQCKIVFPNFLVNEENVNCKFVNYKIMNCKDLL